MIASGRRRLYLLVPINCIKGLSHYRPRRQYNGSESVVASRLGIADRSFMIPNTGERRLDIGHRLKFRERLYSVYTLLRLSRALDGKLVDFGRFAMKTRCHDPFP